MNGRPKQRGTHSEPGRERPQEGQDWATFAGERAERKAADRRRSIERSAELEPRRQEISAALHADGPTRRAFLRNSALVAGGIAAGVVASPMARPANAATAPRIAIVGAGLAGLTAAHRIYRSKGWVPTVYEASNRVGGRVRTIRGLAGGQYAEAGAGGIDSRAKQVKWLAQDLGLWPLVDVYVNYPSGPYQYHFGGQFHDPGGLEGKVAVDGDDAYWVWKQQINFLPQWNQSNAASRQIDNMTAAQYIAQNTNYPGDAALSAFQRTWYGVEYGGTIDQLSALAYVVNFASNEIWGGGQYNERYAIPGGNDVLPSTLRDTLPAGTVQYGKKLVAIRQQSGTVRLTFDTGSGGLVDVVADKAIIAIPPPVLNTVDLTNAGFDARMMRVVQQEKLGGNSKFTFQFAQNVWGNQGHSGDALSDMPTGFSWQENFQAYQPAKHVHMNNVNYGSAAAHGQASASVISQTLAAINTLHPGASSQLISGQAYHDNWPNDPLATGSYGYYAPGQFTDFAGYEKVKQGNVHMAGEHTAPYRDRGYMNGAVISGERVASEITGLPIW